MENDEFVDPENYGEFFCLSKEAEESLKLMSEAQIDIMAHLLASNIVRMQREIEDEMKPTNAQP